MDKTDIIYVSLINFIILTIGLTRNNLNNFDKINMYFLLVLIVLFFVFFNHQILIDIIHVIIILYFSILPLFFKNNYLLFVIIFCLNIILYSWNYYNKCPLGRYSNYFNKMNTLTDVYQKNLNDSIYFLLIILYNKFYSNLLTSK